MAEKAFDVLLQLVQRPTASSNDDDDDDDGSDCNLPLCLRVLDYNGNFFPCLVCGKLFKTVKWLCTHSTCHDFQDTNDIFCCFCGLALPSIAALHFHQTPKIPLLTACPGCEKPFRKEHLATHVCRRNEEASGGNSCPFRCGKGHLSEQETMKNHLKYAHGCDEVVQTMDEGAEEETCPSCRQVYRKEGSISLNCHMVLYCPAVGEVQKAFGREIFSKACGEKMDWELIFRQELEATLFQMISSLEAISVSKSNEDAVDSIQLMTFVLHRITDAEFRKFLIKAVSLPPSEIFKAYEVFKGDFKLMFFLWSASIEFNVSEKGPSDAEPNSLASLHDLAINNDNENIRDDAVLSRVRRRMSASRSSKSRPKTEVLSRILKELQNQRKK